MLRLPTKLVWAARSVRSSWSVVRSFSASTAVTSEEKTANKDSASCEEVNKRIMQFFDEPANWQAEEVRSGRPWKLDELRIKSNEDLHRLWYILVKERNMLLTMEEEAKREVENMPSPERIDKVEESMKNIETAIIERNKAYWQLEVGDSQFATRRKAFRRDIFGRWRWIACSEHLIPYKLNSKWRETNAPGFDPGVIEFNRRLREKQAKKATGRLFRTKHYVRQLLARFPDLDLEVIRQRFPDVDVDDLKANLKEYQINNRVYRFEDIFYKKQEKNRRNPV